MSFDREEWLRRYLDDELSGEDERLALIAIAEDPELRTLLKFDMKLRQELASDRPAGTPDRSVAGSSSHSRRGLRSGLPESSLPDGFADSVMQAIDRRETAPSASTPEEKETARTGPADVRSLGQRLWQPRPVMLRPVWSAGIAAALLILLVLTPVMFLSLQDEAQPVPVPVRQIVEEHHDRVLMRFVYVDRDAESVAVAGDFSDWEPITLTRQDINGDVAWTGIIPLERGQHRYMFLKDGERWATDPLAGRYIDDGFGNRNAVINL